MSMSRKDFEAVAAAIYQVRHQMVAGDSGTWAIDTLVSELCDTFEALNPRFESTTFINASSL